MAVGSLRGSAARGIKWTALSSSTNAILQLFQLAILTRLLRPEDFGLIGMITVFITFAQAFSDLGLTNAIIHRPPPSREQFSSLYTAGLLAGIGIYALFLLAAPLIAAFYSEPRLRGLLMWMALSFLVAPLGQPFHVLLQKQLQFNRSAGIEVAAAALGAVIAVSTALAGQGVYSLVWGHLSATLTRTAALVVLEWNRWRPALRLRRSQLSGYLGFGLYQIGERSLNQLSANIDYLIVGRFLGPEILGFYVLAYQLVTTPFLRINPILTAVAFPVFAARQSEDEVLRRGYLEMVRLLALILLPILLALALTAPLLVPVIFGPRWQMAAPLIQILTLLGLAKGLSNPSGTIFLSKGRADIGFKWNLLVALTNTVVFLAAVSFGITALAWSHSLLCVGYLLVALWILRSLIGLPLRLYLINLSRPLLASTALAAVLLAGLLALQHYPMRPALQLASLLVAAALSYALLLAALERDFLADKLQLLISSSRP